MGAVNGGGGGGGGAESLAIGNIALSKDGKANLTTGVFDSMVAQGLNTGGEELEVRLSNAENQTQGCHLP